jgi:hypothetical protein
MLGSAAPAAAHAGVTGLPDCRFSLAQVLDTEWAVSAGTLTVDGLGLPYASYEPRLGTLRTDEVAATDQFAFVASGSAGAQDVALVQLAADGRLIRTLHLTGSFRAVGPGFILYLGNGFRPTLITTAESLTLGATASFPVSMENLTIEQALAHTACSASPLRAVAPSAQGGAPVPGTVPTGGGPMPLVPLPLGLTVGLLAAAVLVVEQQRARAWVLALATLPRRRRTLTPGASGHFDLLQIRLELLRDGLR